MHPKLAQYVGDKLAEIKIKKCHQGQLHRDLGISGDEPIPTETLEAARHSENDAVRRRAQFAINARQWNHKKADLSDSGLAHVLNDGSPDHIDWRWGLGGSALTRIPIAMGSNAYGKALPDIVQDEGNTSAYNSLLNTAKDKNVHVGTGESVLQRVQDARPKEQTPLKKLWSGYQDVTLSAMKDHPYYEPSTNSISMGRQKSPSTLAHELGHAAGPKVLSKPTLRAIGGLMYSVGDMGAAWSRNEDTARNSAIVGTAGMMPVMASEVDASMRGAKMLRGLGLKGRGAFKGLPTYAAATVLPGAIYGVKKMLGGYDPSRSIKKGEAPLPIVGLLFPTVPR